MDYILTTSKDLSTSSGNQLFFNLAGNTKNFFNYPGSSKQPTFVADFTGGGQADILFYNPGDQNWWLGQLSSTNQLTWNLAGNTKNFFNYPGSSGQPTFVADFTGNGQKDILFYNPGDQNWWLGQLSSTNQLTWSLAGNTKDFFNYPGSSEQPTFVADFTGNGQKDILFYNPGDQNWWLGQLTSTNQLTWSLAGNTKDFFNYPGSSGQPTFVADFIGNGQTDILFYNPGDQNWWLGQLTSINQLTWSLAGNTKDFFNYPGSSEQPTFVADFNGNGQTDILFYNPGDQNWWLGQLTSTNQLTWSLAGNTKDFFNYPGSSEQPTFVADFNGNGQANILFYNPGDQNWWLGQLTSTNQLTWSLAGNTKDFFNYPGSSGQPTFVADFTGNGEADILFYNPGDQNWWLGQVYYPSQMLMMMSGDITAPYIDSYDLQNNDFTVTVMVQPTTQGTIISTSSFELSLNSKGAIEFSVYRSSSSASIITGSTSIINSNQCHIITCSAPESQQPSIYLDGQLLSATSQTACTPPASNQAVLIGNNAVQNNQYKGGLMNIGLWNRILSERESILSGYGQIEELGVGPVAYWYLNNSLKDSSIYSNDLQPGSANFSYMTCLNCITLYGPNSYSFCQIEGTFQPGPVTNINYTQTMRVGNDAVALLGTVIDNSGFARFPEGVFVQVTDPNGKIYNQDASPTDGSVFVKTHVVSGYATNSLFALLVNKPVHGIWTVTVTAPSNVNFLFQMQAYPSKDIIASHLEAFQGLGGRGRRAFQTQSWGRFFAFSGLAIVAAVVIVASYGTATGPVMAAFGTATGIIAIGQITTPIPEPIKKKNVEVTIQPDSSTHLYNSIINDLKTKHSNLKGKVWDACKGTLTSGSWLLQSGTVVEENNTKAVFNSLVNSAKTSIDILIFGDLSGSFKDDIKNVIQNHNGNLTIRIFSGYSPNVDISWTEPVQSAKKLYKTVVPTRFFASQAYNFLNSILKDLGSIPNNINLLVGSGGVPNQIVSRISCPDGWGHHKIIIADGAKAIIGGMNFSQDSLNSPTDPNDAVNDASAYIQGSIVGSVQKFINNFWTDLYKTNSSFCDISSLYDNQNIHGGYYVPDSFGKGVFEFTILTSQTFSNIKSEITKLNNSVFNSNASGGSSKTILVGRRSGYYYKEREPSDIAIIDIIKSAKKSLFLSQQAMCYPTDTTIFVWDEAIEEIRLALKRGVSVRIIVSRDKVKEGQRGIEGGYSSDYATAVRDRILGGDMLGSSVNLKVRNFPFRNHAKIVIVDSHSFYIGSQNIYPSKLPIPNYQRALELMGGTHLRNPETVTALTCLQFLPIIIPESYLKGEYEVGLGECGIIVCDNKKTNAFIQSYWNPKWDIALEEPGTLISYSGKSQ